MTRAKFIVTGKELLTDGGARVDLVPVTGGSDENKEFYKWTPGGQIWLSTINESVAEKFEIGKSYYVDFTPAE